MATWKEKLQLVDKVSKPMQDICKNTEKATKSTENLKKRHSALLTPLRNTTACLTRLDRKLRDASRSIEKFSNRGKHIKELGNNITSFGQKLTVGVTLPLVAMGGAMIKSASDMQTMQTQLSTMLQSEEKGAKMFNDIKKMASKTPFSATDLITATNTMLGFGIAEQKVLPLMQQLGDIAGGNKDRFQSLALAFSQVSSAGKLQGQDLMQMINAGFNPLEAISKKTGKSMAELKDEMSKGKITVQMVEDAMRSATSQGGRFYGMMDKMSKTAQGQWSTLQDNVANVLAEFGEIILPYVNKGMEKLTQLLQKISSLTPAQKKFIIVLGSIVALIPLLITGIGGLITTLASLTVAFNVLSANPIALTIAGIVAVIVALGAGIFILWKNWDKVWNGIKTITQNIANFVVGLIKKIVGFINDLIDKLGVFAYLIPGISAIKIGKDIAGMVSNKTSNTTTNNTNNSISGSYNTTNITNYNGSVGSSMSYMSPRLVTTGNA